MVATHARSWAIARLVRERRLSTVLTILLTPVLLLPALLIGVSWWFTAPLDPSAHASAPREIPIAALQSRAALERREEPCDFSGPPRVNFLAWPESRLEGAPAKQLLLEVMLAGAKKLESVDGYTATFHKRERIGGKLGEEQTLEMKVRHHPFAVYLKFVDPDPGKEVVYAEGCRDNMVIAHGTGWGRRLVPRLALPPTSPLALAENRHPITDAGVLALVNKLIRFREMDLDDAEAVTILDRARNADGGMCFRSLHTHPHRNSERPFARVEVLYDPETLLPIEITSYDWPETGETDELLLAEHYVYENVDLSASLTDLDFDPANPDYAFRRY